ncbi:hypothetical protein [Halobacterium jilantaiense]|uniref:Uncharacterized protein n=1 Tax=Halobacterium jilantaiense TaxID=355548 RepID=A0A1I0PNP6_9EURY|nr:hypothetical protein [Halobacterium jilantaiense]SEW15458.1 hypothetical protein SAMN04487945_1798 [Halobacterium jilantaiense]
MVERADPARTGVRAGRVVGALTAVVAAASLAGSRETYYDALAPVAAALLEAAGVGGVGAGTALSVYFWGNVALAAAARYAVCYVAGSLVGVVYDWFDRRSVWVLAGLVVPVALADGALAVFDTRSVAVGAGYVGAWLCYVPVFAWLSDGESGRRDGDRGPGRARRLGTDGES